MGDLNGKMSFDNTFIGHMMRKQGFGNRSEMVEDLLFVYCFHCLVIGVILFEHKVCRRSVGFQLADIV